MSWDRDLRRCTCNDVELLRAWRQEQGGIGKVSANKEVRCLRRLFNLAIRQGYLPEGQNPCRQMEQLKTADRPVAYCSPARFQAMVCKAGEEIWQAMITVFCSTGIRRREATNLTWADIDVNSAELRVAAKKRVGYVREWTPKD